MTEFNTIPETDKEPEHYPLEPRYHPIHRIPRMIFDFLASSKLAMFLLVAILVCCVAGVTVYRGQRAWELIFSTLWFNGLLVLLVVNVACCFFGRVWYRKLSVVSFGMILFHLSFVAMFVGIIYNSLFFFEGSIRLTEGETLPNGEMESYDRIRHGRFFSYSKLRGETSLIKMHTGYKVEGEDKRAAYEVSVSEGGLKKQGIVYITHNLDFKGCKYLPEKEGYSTLVILSDKLGKELYGAHVPLQSIKQKNGSYLYTTGTKTGPGSFPFPQSPLNPLFNLQIAYYPEPKKDRAGEVRFQVWPYAKDNAQGAENPLVAGKVAIGKPFDAGEYTLSVREIRYWVGMGVRYSPGKPIVLTSLWVGLFGMFLTTIGRIIRGRR